MELKFKQPLGETKKIMSKVAIGKTPLADKDISFKDIAEYKILDLTHHNHCQLVNSGNGAIFIEDFGYNVAYTIRTDYTTNQPYVYVFKVNLKPKQFGLMENKNRINRIISEVLNQYLRRNLILN